MEKIVAVDLFCGAGGLTHGLVTEGIKVAAGIDSDSSCKYAYEKNNNAVFIGKTIEELSSSDISKFYPKGAIKVLVGCAPCQPFSAYAKGKNKNSPDKKWKLLEQFTRLILELNPDVVSMENVPRLKKNKVYRDFLDALKKCGHEISENIVYCPDYGIPQSRTRLVVLASKLNKIRIVDKTHKNLNYVTVKDAIGGGLEPLSNGEASRFDPLHRTSRMSELNELRITNTPPGGSWKDWDESMISACHKKESGKSYYNVYGRMRWDAPAPTITTQCCGFGNGRFGHPEQNRAISLREAALIQTFPDYYDFIEPDKPVFIKKLATHIGNAVPVELGRVIARSIKKHLEVSNG